MARQLLVDSRPPAGRSGLRLCVSVFFIAGGQLCLAQTPSSVAATPHFPSDERLISLIRPRVDEGQLTGIVIGLLGADGSTRVVSHGHPGPGARPLGGHSVFEIGSVTKVFTGTLLADMVAGGEVALTDPVSRYLPDHVTVPARGGKQITLGDLATHHSGLPRMPPDFAPVDPANPYADFTVEKMYSFLSKYHLPRDIGSAGEYSNLGVGLLGHALARAVGGTYEQLVSDRILKPLKMGMTGIRVEGQMAEWMVKGHDREKRVVPLYDAPAIAAAGALRSNAEDLLKFLAANARTPESRLGRAMRDAQVVRKQLTKSLGIGLTWQVITNGDTTIVMHGGGTGGFQSFIGFDTNKGIAIAILINSRSGERNDAQNIGLHLLTAGRIPLR